MEDCESFSGDFNSRSKPSAATSFVRKLYNLVSCESEDVVSFTPDGTAFEVKDPKKLEAEILPKYFRHSRFQSFVRQLNFYNFKKTNKERSMWIYKHELFRRDRPDLLDKLKRKTSCGDVRRLARSVSTDSSPVFSPMPRHASWAALVKSSSESFLQLSGGEPSSDDSPDYSETQTDMLAPLPPKVPLNFASLQQAARSIPEHAPLITLSTDQGMYVPSPSGVATSMSPKYSTSPRRANMGAQRQVPPPPLVIRKRSAEMMQNIYTDDEEDDGGETDVSSGSSWETSRSTRSRLAEPVKEQPLSLGAFAEMTVDEDLLSHVADMLAELASTSPTVVPSMVLFSLRYTLLAVETPEQVRNEIIKFILDHPDVSDELRAYRVALDPSLFYMRDTASPRSPSIADPVAHRLLQTQGCFDRARIARDFIAFSLMQLQAVVSASSNLHGVGVSYRRLLDDSHRLWRRTAAHLS